MQADNASNFLKTSDFSDAGYDVNLRNGLRILDSKIVNELASNRIQKKITLTSAQILALNTTPIELVAAPGASSFIVLEKAYFKLNYGSAAYATNTQLAIKYDSAATNLCTTLYDLLSQTADTIESATPDILVDNGSDINAYRINVNESIEVLAESGNPITGDGTVDIIVEYRIMTDFSTDLAVIGTTSNLIGVSGTFVNGDLVASKLEIHHELGSENIMVQVEDDSSDPQIYETDFDWAYGDSAGADTSNYITIDMTLHGAIANTWKYFLVVKE